jgi:phosphoribosylanthranilate isomerase
MSVLVKICGITSLEDAQHALQAGADWIGLNLVGGPRRLDIPAARSILSKLNDCTKVFVLADLQAGRLSPTVPALLRDFGVHRLQLYGDVTPEAILAFGQSDMETVVAFSIAGDESLDIIAGFLAACGDSPPNYLLFDAAVRGQLGGTGTQADWDVIAKARATGLFDSWPPIILAGGLTPGNVRLAINKLSPAGVDVSSGVESIPGRKDHQKVAAFIAAVCEAAEP